MHLELIENPDILTDVGRATTRPFVVRFAAETDDLQTHAREKLRRKGADMIAANLVGAGKGFENEQNALLLLWADGSEQLPQADKLMLARALIERVAQRYHEASKNA